MTDHAQGAGDSASVRPPTQVVGQRDGSMERSEYLDSLKAQIRKGIYRPDVKDLARSLATMIVREL